MSEGCCCFTFCFTLVGILVIGKCLFNFFLWVYQTCFFKSKKLKKFVGKEKWAIVTGCASGIGDGFSNELASKKTNLVLIDYAPTLPQYAKSIEEKYGVKTIHKVMDLSKPTNEEAYDYLKEQLKGKQVTVLINNVGINTRMPRFFHEHSEKELEMFYNVNMRAHFDMTRKLALPSMMENKKGLIINLASYMGMLPVAMYSVYSATKAFIGAWTKAARGEYKKHGIEMYAVAPMFVKSNMTGFRKTKTTLMMAVISGRHMARIALDRCGCPLNPATFSPHWHHSIWTYLFGLFPDGFYQAQGLKRHIKLQKYYMRKDAEKKSKQN